MVAATRFFGGESAGFDSITAVLERWVVEAAKVADVVVVFVNEGRDQTGTIEWIYG